MIAEIIPFVRLPRQLATFTYAVPPELAGHLAIGQYVKIPFRTQKIFGLVVEIKPNQANGLKSVEKIINPIPLIGHDYIEYLKKVANFYGVSLSMVSTLALPPLQSQKITDIEVAPWNSKKGAPGQKPTYHWYHSPIDHLAAYAEYSAESIVIIVPEVNRISEVKASLSPERQAETLLWSSDMSVKEQRLVWFAIRNHTAHTLIATRGGLWLPLQQSFDRIILDYEHSINHKHWDQAPRYHTKDLAKLLSRNFGLDYTEMSYSPSVSSWYFINNGNYLISNPTPQKLNLPTIIQQSPGPYTGVIHTATVNYIENSLTPETDVVIIHNRKGTASQLFCRDCGFVNRCSQCDLPLVFHKEKNQLQCHYCNEEKIIPLLCSQCGSSNIAVTGTGIEGIVTEIKKKINLNNSEIYQASADEPLPELINPQMNRVIVGTNSVLPNLDWKRVKLLVMLDLDRQLQFPEYEAEETVWHLIHDSMFHLPKEARFLVQSRLPDHSCYTLLNKTEDWYTKEIRVREQLGYPPFSYLIRYLISGKTEIEAQEKARAIATALTHQLTNRAKKIILQGPIATEPKYSRGAYWNILMLKITESDILANGQLLNSLIKSNVKIDPHPISLLSPH